MRSSSELEAVADELRRLGTQLEARLFAGSEPDGDLGSVPGLLAQVAAIEAVADPNASRGGFQMGVWGRHVNEEGAALSLLALSLLGEVCAGLAGAVHAQGLGCLALDGADVAPPGTSVAAGFLPPYGLSLDPRTSADGLTIRPDGAGYRLEGTSSFLLASGRPEWLACFARMEPVDGGSSVERASARREWALVAIPAESEGLALADVGPRTGMRATSQWHLTAEAASMPEHAVLRRGREADDLLHRVLTCDWLGQAAIALGSARRAIRDAQAYAAGRYQGGEMIAEHAAVRLLLAQARHDVSVLAAVLESRADEPLISLDPMEALRWGITARLALSEHAHRAVTNSLQVLGGYGYMDDYGLSKRLRDVTTLCSLHGGPDQLLLLRQQLALSSGARDG